MFLRLRQFPLSEDESFFVRRITDKDFTCPYHFHLEIEIVLIEKGFTTLLVGNNSVPMTKGDIFILGCNTPHFTHNSPGDSKGPEWAQIVLAHLLPDCFGEKFLHAPEFRSAQSFISLVQGSGYKVKGSLKKQLTPILKGLPDKHGLPRLIDTLTFFHYIASSKQSDLIPLTETREIEKMHQQDVDRLSRVFYHIRNNIGENIRLAEAAKIAGMAPASFSRFFHQKTEQTFQEHLTEVRLNEACARLIQTEDTIIEICHACGFNNLSNFNRHFKTHYKTTPQELRKRYRA